MYKKAARIIKTSKNNVAFTGAGISVESGIPPFRGENGLWNKYNPTAFEIGFFHQYPRQSWEVIREIFYDLYDMVEPNVAHYSLVELEAQHLLSGIITQNIDHLHFYAGSRTVHEYHGSLKMLICLDCNKKTGISGIDKL